MIYSQDYKMSDDMTFEGILFFVVDKKSICALATQSVLSATYT